MFGFININKPSGITSQKVISIIRKITGIKQIGHAGTLDPIASGVLPVAIGKATKLIDYLSYDKEYIVSMYLGKISDTYDTEGIVRDTGFRKIERREIEKIIPLFLGEQEQLPPIYSAVHYNGKRLYELARKGEIPKDIEKRKIEIYNNEIISFDYEKQILKLKISCSKGTYIRSIVHDMGQILGSGAVMFELIRTKSSGLKIEDSIELTEGIKIDDIKENIINPISILSIEKYEINEEENNKLQNGNKFKNRAKKSGIIILTENNKIKAIAEANIDFIQPKKVLI